MSVLLASLVSLLICSGWAVDTCTWGHHNNAHSEHSSSLSCTPLSVPAVGAHIDAGEVVTQPFGQQAPSVEMSYTDAGLVRYAEPSPRHETSQPAVIATVQSLGPCGDWNRTFKMQVAEEKIKISAERKADLVVFFEGYFLEVKCSLPINATCRQQQQEILDFCASRSKKYSMWILCPLYFYPLGEDMIDPYNSVVVFNRTGDMVGRYDKMFPVYHPQHGLSTEHVTPSKRGVQVFDTDFGFRFCIMICNDIMMPEIWHQCAGLGAELIFWSAAWKGGRHVNAMALTNQVHVVNSPAGCGSGTAKLVDNTGYDLSADQILYNDTNLKIAYVNQERVVIHDNFGSRLDAMLQQHPEIQVQVDPVSEWRVLSPNRTVQPWTSVRKILREWNIPTITELAAWNRFGVNMARMKGGPLNDLHPAFPTNPDVSAIGEHTKPNFVL